MACADTSWRSTVELTASMKLALEHNEWECRVLIGQIAWQKLGRPVSAVWFDSNAVEMTTTKHCMYLTKFCEFIQLWRIEYYAKNLHICLIIITMTFQIYKSWSLFDSNSTKTRTGACITQNQNDWRRCKLKHKHSHSPYVQVGLQHLSLSSQI